MSVHNNGDHPRRKIQLVRCLFPFIGLACLIWFLVRVIAKPSRATYPCQKIAFPLASGFVIWLMGLAGSAAAFHKAKHSLARARYAAAAVFITASVAFIWITLNTTDEKITYGNEPRTVNSPIGAGKGVHLGRVAWIHDPNATNWAGPGSGQRWYSDTCTNQQVVNEMLSKSLQAITGRNTDYAAWDAIFKNFNQRMGRGITGYAAGEKIAIKVNMTLMDNTKPSTMEKTSYKDNIDNSPQLAIALLKQLTDVAGVAPEDISIGDPTRIMPNYWFNMVEPNCPNVVYLTNTGYAGCGRTFVTADTNAPFYWSDPCAADFNGVIYQDYIPTHFAQATYFINFSILKSHSYGITLSGKNNYGSLIREPDTAGYYKMHLSGAANGMGNYRAIVDLMGHPKLGGKTLLALIDGLYAGQNWNAVPVKWMMTPFDNNWPSSIILSMDQVAADSVGDDFLYTEWTDFPHKSGADDYMHEAALIPYAPSGTNYDPNHDGGLTESLGVHEHWNNSIDKQYTRNLGTDDGIELVTSAPGRADLNHDGIVDFKDFAIFANAWGSIESGPGWDPNCDISSTPGDGVIDQLDLAVLCDNYINEFASI